MKSVKRDRAQEDAASRSRFAGKLAELRQLREDGVLSEDLIQVAVKLKLIPSSLIGTRTGELGAPSELSRVCQIRSYRVEGARNPECVIFIRHRQHKHL